MTIGSFMPASSAWAPRLAALAREFPGHEIIADPERARGALPRLDAMLASKLETEAFEAASSLKALFVPIVGVNHLPTSLLLERGVRVFNAHGNAQSVAQCALAMTLAFYGRTIEYHNDLRQKRWHGFWVGRGSEDEWSSIWGRSCAIFGTGAIGQALARLLKAFECPVVGYRRRAGLGAPPGFDRIETDLAAAVASSEILFIALPQTPATAGLFSKEILLSARGKFLVNVGRGAVVDEEGLYLALRDGVLKGAAIDTWYRYPQGGSTEGAPSRFPVHELPNVVLSPHVGGSTREAMPISMDATCADIARFLRGEECENEVDLRELY
jgi:phosphoglycerate dehydrogenase-like enzyme